MFGKLFDSNEKQLKTLQPVIDKINGFSAEFEKFTPEQIKEKTKYWQEEIKKLGEDEKNGYLEEILPEAFALAREAGRRSVNMRHFDVQLLAGIVLHEGKIAEQKTGEGKTLTATLPLYLNSLTGRGVHLVTPNDYLSRHGAGWMGPIYNTLGISVGVIMEDKAYTYDPAFNGNEFEDTYAVHLREVTKQEAYSCDVVYGTNHHFGFDYLRDNMVHNLNEMVQTNKNGEWGVHNFAIVDEVDNLLIDEARTPLIISGPAQESGQLYKAVNDVVSRLKIKVLPYAASGPGKEQEGCFYKGKVWKEHKTEPFTCLQVGWDPQAASMDEVFANVTKFVAGQSITWDRNPYYYAVDTKGNQLPYIDGVDETQIQDAEVRKLTIMQGGTDFQNFSDVTLADVRRRHAHGLHRETKD